MIVERGNRQAEPSVCFLLCATFLLVALDTVLMKCIQCALAGFVLSSSLSVTELVYFCCEDKQCCLNSVRGLKCMSRSTNVQAVPVLSVCQSVPFASAFYANIVLKTKYRGLMAKGQSSVFKPLAQHDVPRSPFLKGSDTLIFESLQFQDRERVC